MKRRMTRTAIVNGADTAKNSHCPCSICLEIRCVHSHHARDEGVRKEDDGDGGKDVNSFGVVFSSHADRVSGLLNRELLAPTRVS